MDIPGYRILREIGRGGMSTVYLAVQESLDRQVALKVMSQGQAGSQDFKDRFLKEGRIVAQLNHRNIVTIYDIGFVDGVYFIAMEYVVGRNLDERIREGLSVKQSTLIMKRIARALGHAHERGFVHRDIKPSNILFRDDKDAVLADFGIAKSFQEDKGLTKTGVTPGTPNYMSPEQLMGTPLDGRSDLYSLGVVFYEMLTRVRPFEADTGIATAMRHISEPPPELPDPFSFLRPIMSRLLAKEPTSRFSTATEFIKALDRCTNGRSAVTLRESKATNPESAATRFEPDRTRSEPDHARLESAPLTTVERAPTRFEQTPRAIANKTNAATLVSSAFGWRPNFSKGPLLWRMTVGIAIVGLVVAFASPLIREIQSTRQDQLTVERLLSTAREQLKAAQLLAPRNDNAYRTFRKILAIKPDHAGALKSMARIERIIALLENARRQMADGKYLEPRGDSALDAYRQVRALDPSNLAARQGLRRIAAHYLSKAREAHGSGAAGQALAAISNGLRAVPNDPALLKLQAEIREQP